MYSLIVEDLRLRPKMLSPEEHITSPNDVDVINGRGQGVQRHAGNEKYRALVLYNKSLYAKCHKTDKAKISKAIVAAVRQVGGRFLELDEMSQIYHDIGDKKAYAKTSQALREGQKQIRQKIYSDAGQSKSASSLLESIKQRPIPLEEYFRYSIQVLESLHKRSTETHPSPSLHIHKKASACTTTKNEANQIDESNLNLLAKTIMKL